MAVVITIAHQGGWDEFLFFVVPVALGLWALRRAEKRARSRAEKAEPAETESQDAN